MTLLSNKGRSYTGRRIMRLDELWQTFVVRLVMHLKYHEDGHKTHYQSRTNHLPLHFVEDAQRKVVRPDG